MPSENLEVSERKRIMLLVSLSRVLNVLAVLPRNRDTPYYGPDSTASTILVESYVTVKCSLELM